MEARRNDETVVTLKLTMSPNEAEYLRRMMESAPIDEESEIEASIRLTIRNAIGRVY